MQGPIKVSLQPFFVLKAAVALIEQKLRESEFAFVMIVLSVVFFLAWKCSQLTTFIWSGHQMICLVVLLTVVVSAVDSFSRGAPLSQCGFMTPKHGFQPQPHPPNANITYRVLDKGSQAKQITVTLSSQSGQFRGYILRAEDPASTLKEGLT